MRHPWIRVLGVTLAATGCGGEPAGPTGPVDLVVATDKPAYSFATDSVARVTLTNRSDRFIYVPMSIYVVYERLRDGEWREERVSRTVAIGP